MKSRILPKLCKINTLFIIILRILLTEYLFLMYNMVWYKKISLSQAEGGEIDGRN